MSTSAAAPPPPPPSDLASRGAVSESDNSSTTNQTQQNNNQTNQQQQQMQQQLHHIPPQQQQQLDQQQGKHSPKDDQNRPYNPDNVQHGGPPPPNYNYMDPKMYPRGPPGPPNGRFMGQTPTLNKLLQSPQRGPPVYSDQQQQQQQQQQQIQQQQQQYPQGPPAWHARPPHYPHQVQAPTFRPPVQGQTMEAPPSPKRPPSNGPPQQGPPPGSPYARGYPPVGPRPPYHLAPQSPAGPPRETPTTPPNNPGARRTPPINQTPYPTSQETRGQDESSNEGPPRGASPASNPGSRSMSPSGYSPNHGGPPPEGFPGGSPNSFPGGPPNKVPAGPPGPPGQYSPMGFPQGYGPPRPGYGPPPGAPGYGQYPRFPQQGYPPGPPGQIYHQGGAPPGHPGGMMPPPSQYGYPPPRGGPPPPNVTAGGPGGPPQGSPGSPRHPGAHPTYLRQHLQQKIYGYSSPMTPPMQDGVHPVGPPRGSPSPAPDRSMSPRANGPAASTEKQTGSQPPTAFDEGSQASNASASSSTADDSSSNQMPLSTNNNGSNQPNRLHPSGPTPSPRSMSSFPEDYDGGANSRSPAPSPLPPGQQWPPHPQGFPPHFSQPGPAGFHNQSPTAPPASAPPPVTASTGGGGSKGSNSIQKQYELGPEPERKDFVDRLLRFNEEKGTAITTNPTISKQPLDLYRLYILVRERGGFMEVTKQKAWRDIAGQLNVGASSSAAYTLRKQYTKHVLPYECRFDRGNIDPQPIIDSLESPAARKKKNANAAVSSPQEPNANSNPAPPSMPTGQYHTEYQQSGPPQPPSHSGPPVSNYPPPPQGYPDGRPPAGYPPGHPGHLGHPGPQTATMNGPYPPQGPHPGVDPSQYPPGYPPGYPSRPPQAYPPHATSPQQQQQPATHGNGPVPSDYPSQGLPPQPQQLSSQQPQQQPSYGITPSPQQQLQQQAPSQHHQSPQPTPPPAAASPFPSDKSPTPQSQPPQSPAMISSRSQSPAVCSPRPSHTPGPPAGQDNSQSNHIKQEVAPTSQGGQPSPSVPPTTQSVALTAQQGPLSAANPQGSPGQGPPHGTPPQHYMAYPPQHMPPQGAPPSHMAPAVRPPMSAPGGYSGHPNMSPHHQGMTSNVQPQSEGPPPNRGPPYDPQKAFQQGPGHNGPPMRGFLPGPQGSQGSPRPDFYNKRHPDFSKDQGPLYGGPQGYERVATGMQGYPSVPRQNSASPGSGNWVPRSQFSDQRWPGPPQNQPEWLNSQSSGKMGPPYMGGQMCRVGPPQPYMQQRMTQPSLNVLVGTRMMIPPDCVEAVTPLTTKRRRLFAKDVAPVDAWRLMMSLKSGLLAESTWALDVISILMYDDNSILFFGLQHLPGFLETLLEHYRKCLSEMLGITDDLELGYDVCKLPEETEDDCKEKPWFLLEKDIKARKLDESSMKYKFTREAPMLDLTFAKRNSVTQDGKPVRFRDRETPAGLLKFLENGEDVCKKENWEDFEGGYDHWSTGGGEITSHIVTHFESERQNVRFCKVYRDKKDNDLEWAFELQEQQKLINITPVPIETPEIIEKEIEDALLGGEQNDELHDSRKRRRQQDLDDEAYTREEPSLSTITDHQESLGKRTAILSTIIRNLSFVPGNETEISKHPGLLLIIGRLLLLDYKHNARKARLAYSKVSRQSELSAPSDGLDQDEWWWQYLPVLRENSLVILSNISTHLDLGPYSEEVSLPIMDGLLHWAVCESACAQDPLPGSSMSSSITLQRLAVETLCKLSVQEVNVDLMLATPPWSRIDRLIVQLSRWMARGEEQVLREFAVVLISNMVPAESYVARTVALAGNTISYLIAFVEQAEQSALNVANQQGITALRDNPELMGTTLDMVRRAAGTLKVLARVPENRTLFVRHQQRLLTLVMSQILDQGVAANIADVLYQVAQCDDPPEPAFEPPSESEKDIKEENSDDGKEDTKDINQNGITASTDTEVNPMDTSVAAENGDVAQTKLESDKQDVTSTLKNALTSNTKVIKEDNDSPLQAATAAVA